VVIGDGFYPFEFATACEIFGSDRPELAVNWYRLLVCSVHASPVRSQFGF
jgi:hypothetical protein